MNYGDFKFEIYENAVTKDGHCVKVVKRYYENFMPRYLVQHSLEDGEGFSEYTEAQLSKLEKELRK